MNQERPSQYWKYWTGRLIILYLMGLITCTVGFPILIYLVIPALVWLFADIPYTWPTPDYLMKWVRYGLWCTVGVGTISWLGEFVPWLLSVIRGRKP